MAEYIDKDDLKFLEIPIAPILQGEQVHYEQGFLKEWLESVPVADVIERSKIDKAIEEIKQLPQYIARFPDWTEIHVSLTDVLKVLESIGE